MFLRCSLILFVLCAFGLAEEEWERIPGVVECSSKCTKPVQATCRTGCGFAYARTLRVNDVASIPTCAESCNSNFKSDRDRSSCIEGCVNFLSNSNNKLQNDKNSVFSSFEKFAQKMSNYIRQGFTSLLGNREPTAVVRSETAYSGLERDLSEALHQTDSALQNQEAIDSNQNERGIHFRIIVRSNPNVGMMDNDPEEFRKSIAMLFGSPLGESDGPLSENDQSVDEAPRGPMCVKFMSGINRVFKSPFNLLLALSLLALLLLLIAQIALCVLRKPRPQSDSVYAQLPSYEEAVEIKIPLDMQDFGFKVLDKAKPTNENPAV